MEFLQGAGISRKILFGKCVFFEQNELGSDFVFVSDIDNELVRMKRALQETDIQLRSLYKDTADAAGLWYAEMIGAHRLILNDIEFVTHIENQIEEFSYCAEHAVFLTCEYFAKILSETANDYIKARISDVKEVCSRLVRNLKRRCDEETRFRFFRVLVNEVDSSPIVVCAREIFISDVLMFKKVDIGGFITETGSNVAHVSILAQSLELVGVVGVGKKLKKYGGQEVIVSGSSGTAIISPTEEKKDEYWQLVRAWNKESVSYNFTPGIDENAEPIKVMGNVSYLQDVEKIKKVGASGIGLFRSEFLYLGRRQPPSESEQFEVYKSLLENSNGDVVIIRTLDIGAGKVPSYFRNQIFENQKYEERGIRFCLRFLEMFRLQLRALLRASVYGNLKIILPMVTSIAEVLKVTEMLNSLKCELNNLQIAHKKDISLGVMIETPAAVVLARELAEIVDFFSIGTNDLMQLTFAIDRNSMATEDGFFDIRVLLKMIDIAVEAAKERGIPVGVCGVYAEKTDFLKEFINLGVDWLSVSVECVDDVRKKVNEILKQINKTESFEN